MKWCIGPPERTRTSDLRIRSPLLYPAELQAEVSSERCRWSGREDLNLRPPAPKAGALPDCATPRLGVHSLFAKIDHPKAGSEYKFQCPEVSMATGFPVPVSVSVSVPEQGLRQTQTQPFQPRPDYLTLLRHDLLRTFPSNLEQGVELVP